jgi:EmrB/QacA subfamily drug resistance transporter
MARDSPRPAPWGLCLAVLITGMFMAVLDVTIVNVAIPSIQKDLGATVEDVLWIATAYTLTLGVVVPLSSWLGDRVGLNRAYQASLLGFGLGSALCGLAWDLDSLIACRVVQAIAGGILPVMTMTLLYRIVPRERLGAAMGLYGLGIVFAPATGPVLGGYLVEHTNWRMIFFINLPVALLGLVSAHLVLPRFGPAGRRPLDVGGFLTAAFGLFSVLLGFSKAEDWGWTAYPTLILVTAGALSLALFVVIELEVAHPLIDVRVFLVAAFRDSLLVLAVLTIGLFAMVFYVPVFLQQGQGLTAFESGLRILPQAIVVGCLMPVAGRLYDRIGARWLVVAGLSVSGLGAFLLSGINPDMTEGDVVLWTCVRAAGMGLCMMPVMAAGIASLPLDRVNEGSALNNITQQVTASLGLAVLTTMSTAQQAQMTADRDALLTADRAPEVPRVGPGADATLGLHQLYERTQVAVLADSYGNIFLVTAALSVLAIPLGLRLRGRPNAAPPGPPQAGPERSGPERADAGRPGPAPAAPPPDGDQVAPTGTAAGRAPQPARR